jgi:hypothetical protein
MSGFFVGRAIFCVCHMRHLKLVQESLSSPFHRSQKVTRSLSSGLSVRTSGGGSSHILENREGGLAVLSRISSSPVPSATHPVD